MMTPRLLLVLVLVLSLLGPGIPVLHGEGPGSVSRDRRGAVAGAGLAGGSPTAHGHPAPGGLFLEAVTGAQTAAEPTQVAAPAPQSGASRWIAEHLSRLGNWAPVLLIGLLILTCVLCVPGAFITLAGGTLFGFGWGLLYGWMGALLGALVAFLLSRHLFRDRVRRRLARYPKLSAIEDAVSEEGWKVVFLSRLAPGSPFFLLNYLFGLTRIGLWPFLAATAVGMLPGTSLLVYVGALGQQAMSGRDLTVVDWAFRGLGLGALVLLVVLISRRAKRSLDAKLRPRR